MPTVSKEPPAGVSGFREVATDVGCNADANGLDFSHVGGVKPYAAASGCAYTLNRGAAILSFEPSHPVDSSTFRASRTAHGVSV